MTAPNPQVRQGGEAEPWTDDNGLPLVWGLSAPDPDGVRSTHYLDQADVKVLALEPVLDLLEWAKGWTEDGLDHASAKGVPRQPLGVLTDLLREHGRLH
jgi:hypothetical protein